MESVQGIIGLGLLVLLAWLVSEGRLRFPWKVVVIGVALQFAFALLLLKSPVTRDLFVALNRAAQALLEATQAGTAFVFGYLGGAAPPFATSDPGASFILAFQALPLILVISALSALFWHWRILPLVIKGIAAVLTRWLGLSGALSLGAAANIFVGLVEGPLLIRPVFAHLSRSELFVLMTVGMATIAGTVMVLYASILTPVLPDAIGHILTASVISVPAAVLIARVMVPETEFFDSAVDAGGSPYHSAMDAITKGTQEGLTLLLNVIALLIVMLALVALVNAGLGLLPEVAGAPITLERIFGLIFRPFVWCLGIPWSEAPVAGNLMGLKTVLNELVAYVEFAKMPEDALSPRSRLIMLYALCGFANFGSLGIMLGGMSAIAPERRAEIAALGLRAILSGTLATGMTGAVVGLIL